MYQIKSLQLFIEATKKDGIIYSPHTHSHMWTQQNAPHPTDSRVPLHSLI